MPELGPLLDKRVVLICFQRSRFENDVVAEEWVNSPGPVHKMPSKSPGFKHLTILGPSADLAEH